MLKYINILGRDIPMYGICALVGIIFGGMLIAFTLRRRRDYNKAHIINIPIFAAIGAFAGAKIVYFLTRLDFLIKAFQNADVAFASSESTFFVLGELFGGMVFYGGLIGAIFAAFLYCKAAKTDFSLYADIFAPAIPLFHAFGRIGCVFAGCCYGIEASWGLTYTHTHDGIEYTVTRIPLPLIEAGCNLLLMAALLILRKKHLKKGSLLAIYFISYSVIRFTDEFFRGDEIRGVYFGLSTSQWISIFVFIAGVYMLLNRYKLKNKDRFGYHVPVGEVPEGYIYNKYAGAVAPWEQYKLRPEELKEAQAQESAPEDSQAAQAQQETPAVTQESNK